VKVRNVFLQQERALGVGPSGHEARDEKSEE